MSKISIGSYLLRAKEVDSDEVASPCMQMYFEGREQSESGFGMHPGQLRTQNSCVGIEDGHRK